MRKLAIANTFIVILIATMVFSDFVDAKMPQQGDYVKVTSASSMGLFSVDGVVTDIGNGFICLNSNHAEINTSENGSLDNPLDNSEKRLHRDRHDNSVALAG